MEKIIILLLIVVILLLLSDKMPITLSKKRTPQPKATPIPKTAPSTSVMGESRFVPPAKVATTTIPLTEKEQQDILTEWEEEPTINLEDEEEDLRSYRTEAEDNDFATGLSFEDLEKVAYIRNIFFRSNHNTFNYFRKFVLFWIKTFSLLFSNNPIFLSLLFFKF